MRSDSTSRLIREFLAGFSGGEHVQYEPLALDEVAEAQALSYGTAVMPHYRFDQADVVLSLGKDFLGASSNAVGNAADWAKKRKMVDQRRVHDYEDVEAFLLRKRLHDHGRERG